MNLSNASRSQLSRVPGLNRAIDFICARANNIFSVQHDPETGAHTDITADSLELADDFTDPRFDGNVSSDLVPTADGLDLGGVLLRPAADLLDHPWQDLRLSGTLYVGAAWEETVTDGIPTITRGVNGLVIDNQAQAALTITGSAIGTLGMSFGGFADVLNYDGYISADVGFLERSRSTLMGEWTSVAYAAGNFTASAGTWTVDAGDQVTYAYTLVGKTMTLAWVINNTDVSAGASLRLAIPGGFTAAKDLISIGRANDAGAGMVPSLALVSPGATFVTLYATVAAGNFAITAADNTAVQGQITLEVQ